MENWRGTLRVLWLVQFLTTLAINLGLTFIPFYLVEDPVLRVEDPRLRLLYTGLIFAGPFFTTIVFTPLWGWVADRTGPKRQVVRACFGLGITQLLMAAAQSPEQLIAIRMLQGMVSGVLAASLGVVAVVTPHDERGRAVAMLQSATPAGQIFGPLIGGLLAAACGFRATYVLLGSVILASGVLSWLLLRQDGFMPVASSNPFVGLVRSSRRAFAQPALRQAFLNLASSQFAFTVTQGVFAIYAGEVIASWVLAENAASAWWNSGVGFTAIAMTVTGLSSMCSSVWWGRLHDQQVPLLTSLGAVILAGSLLLLFAFPIWWVVLLARIGVGIGVAAMSTLQFAEISKGAAPEDRAQVMGVATSLTHVGNLAGFLLGGILAAWWTGPGNFALAAAVLAFIAVASIRLEQRAPETTSPRPRPSALAPDANSVSVPVRTC